MTFPMRLRPKHLWLSEVGVSDFGKSQLFNFNSNQSLCRLVVMSEDPDAPGDWPSLNDKLGAGGAT